MTTKNYPSSDGYLDPDLRNWETVVYGVNKPVLPKELNLSEDIDIGAGQAALRRAIPSGWISDDSVGTSSHSSGIFIASATANTIQLPQGLIAHVNGWLLTVSNTNVSGVNQLTFPASPSGAGARRTDIVILEVWRKLISAVGGDGKSGASRIWRRGNVKTSPADDLTLNLPDDILDTSFGSESTKRVQIQLRLRVVPGVDLLTYPDGLDDPTIVANSVPTNAATPDGVATLFAYTNQGANGDPGLWRAGDGVPSNTLGTVDGYMYAIPLLAVFRRNSTAFNRNSNQNGGVASPGPSDRPDGLFYDIINARDVADIRLNVSPKGWSYPEVLEKNFNFLLDNVLRSEWVLTTNGGGSEGHTHLTADEIGVSNAHGGDGVVTGDTPGANFLGEFDAVRRRFSDRPMYEILNVRIPQPGGGWADSVFNINFTNLAVYPYSSFNWASFAPAGVIAQDIIRATFIGSAPGKKTLDAMTHILQVTHLGEQPIASLTVAMGPLAGLGITDESLYLDILVCYPPGGGLTLTPTADYGASSFSINNPLALPATAPVSYSALVAPTMDYPHREVQLQYTTVNLTFGFAADTVVAAKSTFTMPERASTIVSVTKNGNPILGTTSLSADGRTVTFNNAADFTSPGDFVSVTYTALRPLPQNGEQITVWYESRGPQTIRDSLLGTTLTVEPKYMSPYLYVLTTGSGSQDEGYPFPSAYVQTGGIYPSSVGSFNGEHELSARASTSIADFSSSTGFLRLPIFVPCVSNPESATFNRASPGDVDIENRTFFKSVPAGYLPNAYAQDLSDPAKHKVLFPFLAELTQTSNYGKRGELVLVLLTRWIVFGASNAVHFESDLTQNTTSASVFRLKGNLLDKRT